MNKKVGIAIIATIAVVGAWAAFRPELLFVNQKVNDALPVQAASATSDNSVLATGGFRGIAHETKGTATIHRLDGGKKILRFTDFKTSNGPDVHVYLVAAKDASDNATVKGAGFIDLGSIKGNEGDQNYDLPADADLKRYQAVTIWCARFGVNFGTAPLAAPTASMPSETLEGMFHGVAHETKGTAAVLNLADGKKVLRLSDFHTSNGPDVHVYLVAAQDASDSAAVTRAGFVDLGSIKGNQGDQNYVLPADVDLAKYRAVTIWCARFNVNFATAPLQKKS